MFLFSSTPSCSTADRCWKVGGATSHLQLVVVRLAAAVRLFGRLLIGVKQEADAAVITHLHMFNASKTNKQKNNLLNNQVKLVSDQYVSVNWGELTDGVVGVVWGQRQRCHTGFVFSCGGRSLCLSVLVR